MEGCGGAPPALARELAHKSEELCAVAAQMERAHRQLALHDGGGVKRDLWKVRASCCGTQCLCIHVVLVWWLREC